MHLVTQNLHNTLQSEPKIFTLGNLNSPCVKYCLTLCSIAQSDRGQHVIRESCQYFGIEFFYFGTDIFVETLLTVVA